MSDDEKFDLYLAIDLMTVSATVYMAEVRKRLTALGYDVQLMIDESSTDTQGAILAKDDHVIVVFRGTSSIRDLLTDVNVLVRSFPDDWPQSLVHQGFLMAYLSIRNEVINKLEELFSANQRHLILTGHSLGAAIATICAVDVARVLKQPTTIYTFASPKVGNAEFVKAFNEHVAKSYRLELQGDPVPNIPLIGLEHVPIHVMFDEKCTFTINPSFNLRIGDAIDDIKHVLFGKAYNMHHHFNYHRILEGCRKKQITIRNGTT